MRLDSPGSATWITVSHSIVVWGTDWFGFELMWTDSICSGRQAPPKLVRAHLAPALQASNPQLRKTSPKKGSLPGWLVGT